MSVFSIVIITYNSEAPIGACLRSLTVQEDQDFEVIIVDNGSSDSTVGMIKKNYPRAALIENRENRGACYARNQGIASAKGDWIITLDCDTVLRSDFMRHIRAATARIPSEVGMIQPKILKDDTKTIYSLGVFLSSARRFYDVGHGRQDKEPYVPRHIFGACAAAAVYSRDMLEEVKEPTGYFDERFFFLVEDVDLAWRAQRKGWKAILYPDAVCYHSGNSSKTNAQLRQHLCFRNRYYSILKNEGIAGYSKKFFPIFFYDFPRLCYLAFSNPYVHSDVMRLLRSQAQKCAIFTSD